MRFQTLVACLLFCFAMAANCSFAWADGNSNSVAESAGLAFMAIAGAILVLLVLSLYFLPSIISFCRDYNWFAVLLINLFLGWTFLGWFIALIMAVWAKPKPTVLMHQYPPSNGETSKATLD